MIRASTRGRRRWTTWRGFCGRRSEGGRQGRTIPGMDRNLEHPLLWGDFHLRFIVMLANQVQACLRPRYVASIASRTFRELRVPLFGSHLIVNENRAGQMPTCSRFQAGTRIMSELEDVQVNESRVEILDVTDHEKVVTAIEVVSPSNKRLGPGRCSYRRKRREMLADNINVIEIDVLRTGLRVLCIPSVPRRKTTAPEDRQRDSSPQAQAFRGRIILRCGQGDRPTNEEAAREFDCDPGTVGSGGHASPPNASMAWPTSLSATARGLFPPKDRHKVPVLATTKPTELGLPISHWSLEDLAVRILQDAHYRDVSKSTIQRILNANDLKPHRRIHGCTATTGTFRRKRCTSPHSIWTPHACTNTANWGRASMKRPASRPWSGAPGRPMKPAAPNAGSSSTSATARAARLPVCWSRRGQSSATSAPAAPAGILAGTCGIRPSSFRTAFAFIW